MKLLQLTRNSQVTHLSHLTQWVTVSLTGTMLLILSKIKLKNEKSLLILEVTFLHSKYSTKTGII